MESITKYDIAIIGLGAAGGQLLLSLLDDPALQDKKILVIEKSSKSVNDKTWCFWEKGSGKWEAIISNQWQKGGFYSNDVSKEMVLAPYTYKMIRSDAFYRFLLDKADKYDNVTFIQSEVLAVAPGNRQYIKTSNGDYPADWVFDSRVEKDSTKDPYGILQHFKGWVVETEKPVFDPECFRFMDFRVPQKGNTRFVYVLPFSTTKALVEYTLFSRDLLDDQEYDQGIETYLKTIYGVYRFTVVEKESGVIPMSVYPFEQHGGARHIKIGTAGGWTKASTGFTFKAIEKKMPLLIRMLKQDAIDSGKLINKRFRYYDKLLLKILSKENRKGEKLFSNLFEKNHIETILRFLQEDTAFTEELGIIVKSPAIDFTKALLR